ncbi:TPA: hypothetical protein HH295_17770 [Xanthomonas vasicola pv. zeae]|uniref:Uncharacterized protein n=1 Tax=Xanthomonas vasicola pv. vasculorum TaxID=325776 RepID=A0AAE8JY12_XANVA|nr:hypothetical protein [Xanthomonas vasicola]AVQ05315.1 hypothetical protein C7V42_00160 [Xanthomonas vasicola pv. vasculorum]AZM69510.1 hypothetical protein CXP37_00160 [Xanthomonas vasicola pv. vasculorum]KEZ95886.1 hypothetical protein A11M_0118370 [Xanthomonas vasicola pv. vasculorum NCPPB 895]KFA24539.1 hypothetical protein KW5_0118815 [Xanthomonas vasicola pv. vasculorum NCPPB 1326]KFA31632.1 hypothetical protein KWG_0109995 [Xanthomonas vasicola pv. vasculorum NCPPB 1381]
MYELKSEIAIADQLYNQNMQEVQRINIEMRAQNESGHPDSARMAALQRSFEHFRGQCNMRRQERDQAWEKYNALNLQFVRVVKGQVEQLEPAQARLMAALKNEIGVPTDVKFLLDQIEARQLRVETAVEGILQIFSDPKAR